MKVKYFSMNTKYIEKETEIPVAAHILCPTCGTDKYYVEICDSHIMDLMCCNCKDMIHIMSIK